MVLGWLLKLEGTTNKPFVSPGRIRSIGIPAPGIESTSTIVRKRIAEGLEEGDSGLEEGDSGLEEGEGEVGISGGDTVAEEE